MQKKLENISQHKLSQQAKGGVFVFNMQSEKNREHDISIPHRDDHYMFGLATKGFFNIKIDFENYIINVPTLVFMTPRQVHQLIEVHNPEVLIIFFDASIIDEKLLQLLENKFTNPFLQLDILSAFYSQIATLMEYIHQIQNANQSIYTSKSVHYLLSALINIIAGEITIASSNSQILDNRGMLIKDDFNHLLNKHYITWKQPSQYAAALNISVSHLNDTIKGLTGVPVSITIQQASILEAKRLLYATDKSVKEVSYEVGYDEPVYFGKLFKKITSLTPLEFRKQFRD